MLFESSDFNTYYPLVKIAGTGNISLLKCLAGDSNFLLNSFTTCLGWTIKVVVYSHTRTII